MADPDALFFSVVIVNYNGGAYVQGALDSLKRQTHHDFEVLLVDNNSTDGSAEDLDTSGLPAFTLLRPGENLGFAGGNNFASRQAKGRWLALLNPDAAARPNWLAALHAATRRHPAVRQFASAQHAMHAPGTLDGAGDNMHVLGIPWRGGFGRPLAELPAEGFCFSPCGAGALIEADSFRRHGGFDEAFFCFGEDVDLAYRMRLAGEGECVFLPDAAIDHAGGGLSGRASDFSLRLGARNRLWTFAKNTPPLLLWATMGGHAAATAAILVRGLTTGRAGATWTGVREGLSGLGPVLERRASVMAQRRVGSGAILRAMAWNPVRFLQRKTAIRTQGQKKPGNAKMARPASSHAGPRGEETPNRRKIG